MPSTAQVTALSSGADTRRTAWSKLDSSPVLSELRRMSAGSSNRSPASDQSTMRRRNVIQRGDALLQRDLPEQVDLVEDLAGAEHDGELRVLADHDRQAGLLAQEHV